MAYEMYEFRLHGRGGQGIVIAASVFAEAVLNQGYYARAFSLFGAERRGAPVAAFIRASSNLLMPRSRIYAPDYVVVFDATLSGVTLTAGLKDGGTMIINTGEVRLDSLPEDVLPGERCLIYTVDATAIALKHQLAIGSFPLVNTVMLGAMARVSGLASLDHLGEAIRKRVGTKIEENVLAAGEGYESVKEVGSLVT